MRGHRSIYTYKRRAKRNDSSGEKSGKAIKFFGSALALFGGRGVPQNILYFNSAPLNLGNIFSMSFKTYNLNRLKNKNFITCTS